MEGRKRRLNYYAANAVLHEIHLSVVTKQERFNTTKLSVFKSFLIQTPPPYTQKSWVLTERALA